MHTAIRTALLGAFSLLMAAITPAAAEEIGCVDTAFKLLGPDHKICIYAFDDPKVDGVSCYFSRARKGGITGMVGLAEEVSEFAIACRQVGPVRFREPFDDGEEVFRARASVFFKKLRVVRFYDRERNTLLYLAYSEKLVDGSPKNSISTVPIETWNQAEPQQPGAPQ